MSAVLASIPSPPRSVIEIGPFPLRAYAVAIILGVVVAVVVGDRRWVARGGRKGTVADVATVAVPFGILGARVYHVITSPERYLEEPIAALYVWQGGLGMPARTSGAARPPRGRRSASARPRRRRRGARPPAPHRR